jgi:hypothetical protein
MVGTGRKYTKDGVEKESTTFKFLEVYGSEEAAEKAAFELYSGGNGSEPEADTKPNNAERETALKFLPGLVAMSRGDTVQLATMLAQQPLIAKYFTVQSPEVQELLVMEGAPF